MAIPQRQIPAPARSGMQQFTLDHLWVASVLWLIWHVMSLLPLPPNALWRLGDVPSRSQPVFTALAGMLLGGAILATLPWFTPARLFGPDAAPGFATQGPRRVLLSSKNLLGATEWLAQHPITHIMLDRQWQAALLAQLHQTPGWCQRFADGDAVILARCPAQ